MRANRLIRDEEAFSSCAPEMYCLKSELFNPTISEYTFSITEICRHKMYVGKREIHF